MTAGLWLINVGCCTQRIRIPHTQGTSHVGCCTQCSQAHCDAALRHDCCEPTMLSLSSMQGGPTAQCRWPHSWIHLVLASQYKRSTNVYLLFTLRIVCSDLWPRSMFPSCEYQSDRDCTVMAHEPESSTVQPACHMRQHVEVVQALS